VARAEGGVDRGGYQRNVPEQTGIRPPADDDSNDVHPHFWGRPASNDRVVSTSQVGSTSAKPRRAQVSALARLVGQTRAVVLEALREPKTTLEVAAAARIAPSTASEHLTELAAARVVRRVRSGRFVHYLLNETGRRLVDDLSDPSHSR
jgi:DNA-binding transcriptional ArsR family regulator